MATEDVIELGSSEDESETKKIKPGRNAMVCIPGKLKGGPVRPGSVVSRNLLGKSNLVGKSVTINKISKHDSKSINKVNGKPLRKLAFKSGPSTAANQGTSGISLNPLNIIKTMNSQIKVNKLPSSLTNKKFTTTLTNNKSPTVINNKLPSTQFLNRPIKVVQSKKTVAGLPPSITITRTTPVSKKPIAAPKRPAGALKRPIPIGQTPPIQRKKIRVNPLFMSKEVLTVEELDDDEVPVPPNTTNAANPQWYIRPEEQSEQLEMEQQNNAEPKMPAFLEITIEDSPVKPVKDKRMSEIGIELPITIEDSPAKEPQGKESNTVTSDDESCDRGKDPHSKKKLTYSNETIEIEISPMEVNESPSVEGETNHTVCESNLNNEKSCEIVDIPEVMESEKATEKSKIATAKSQKATEKSEQATDEPEVVIESQQTTLSNQVSEVVTVEDESEFHPVYQSFIDLCFKLENSDDMRKIVEKKIKAYYRQVPKAYTEAEQFIDLVSSKITLIKASPDKMYLYIKDVVDELNLQRKMTKSEILSNETSQRKEAESFLYGEDSEFDSKRQRQIRKLEKTLKKLHRAVQKLEEQEVDFDDEEDSVYLLTERYKERMVRVHAKFCQLTNTKMPSEPRIVIEARPGQPAGPAKRLEKRINKKVPIGTPLPFPDFHDVLRCVREANEEDNLGWNDADIMEEARDLFVRCGKKLQRRRQENEWRLAASRVSSDVVDPAENNELLKKKLDENRQLATKKEAEVFNKFADRQCQLKLEAEEIGDKEAEESPIESEEDEQENSTLENKEKRKERLKRLIQEKAVKKVNNDKTAEPGVSNDDATEAILSDVANDSTTSKVTEEINTKITEEDFVPDNSSDEKKTSENVQTLSDGSDKISSDIDELHLLQKLHSENEVNTSTLESSDTDTPIDISDTMDSGDNKEKNMSDVISIENSSYSESEQDTAKVGQKDTEQLNTDKAVKAIEKPLHAISEEESEQNYSSPPVVVLCENDEDDVVAVGSIVAKLVDQSNDNEMANLEDSKSKHSISIKHSSRNSDLNSSKPDTVKDTYDKINEKVVSHNKHKEVSIEKENTIDIDDSDMSQDCLTNDEEKSVKSNSLREVDQNKKTDYKQKEQKLSEVDIEKTNSINIDSDVSQDSLPNNDDKCINLNILKEKEQKEKTCYVENEQEAIQIDIHSDNSPTETTEHKEDINDSKVDNMLGQHKESHENSHSTKGGEYNNTINIDSDLSQESLLNFIEEENLNILQEGDQNGKIDNEQNEQEVVQIDIHSDVNPTENTKPEKDKKTGDEQKVLPFDNHSNVSGLLPTNIEMVTEPEKAAEATEPEKDIIDAKVNNVSKNFPQHPEEQESSNFLKESEASIAIDILTTGTAKESEASIAIDILTTGTAKIADENDTFEQALQDLQSDL